MFKQFLKVRKVEEIGNVPASAFYSPSLFDEFLFDEETRVSDISFIFNQQRLDKVISKDNFDSYFAALFKDGSPNPYDGLSDDDIMDLVKDRRLSSFNDWYNYTRNLQQDSSDLQRYKNSLVERKKQQDDAKKRFENLRKELGFSGTD